MTSQMNDPSQGVNPKGFSSGPPAGGLGAVTRQVANRDRLGARIKARSVVSDGIFHYSVDRVRLGVWYGYSLRHLASRNVFSFGDCSKVTLITRC